MTGKGRFDILLRSIVQEKPDWRAFAGSEARKAFRPRALRETRREAIRMPLVKVKENESIDKAIRRFKKKCEKEGIIQDIKKSSRYLKPSERKRKKQLKAAKRRRAGKA